MTQLPNAASRTAGFVLLVVATLWLSFMAAGDNALRFDVSITRDLQDSSTRLTSVIEAFGNAFGTAKVGVTLGVVAAAVLIRRGHAVGGAILLAATALRAVNYGLKALFDSPRPTHDLVRVETTRDSNGFPSGHAQGATLLCGALLIALWPVLSRGQRIAASVVASAIVVATAYARVSVGAHWPTDVLGGVLWGVILLALIALAIRQTRITKESPGAGAPGAD